LSASANIKPLPPEPESGHESREDSIFKRVFLSPAVVLLLVLSIFPLIWSLGVSFTDLQRNAAVQAQANQQEGEVERTGFLGLGVNLTLDNYLRIPTDERLLGTARNTLLYVVAGVTFQFALGLMLATLLNQQFVGRALFRVLMPMMMTPVAAGYLGLMMFDSSRSPLAQFMFTISTVHPHSWQAIRQPNTRSSVANRCRLGTLDNDPHRHLAVGSLHDPTAAGRHASHS